MEHARRLFKAAKIMSSKQEGWSEYFSCTVAFPLSQCGLLVLFWVLDFVPH